MTVRLVLGDAGAVLQRIRRGSVKLVIVDPPYKTLDRDGDLNYRDGVGYRQLGWPTIGRHLAMARARLAADGVLMVVVNRASVPYAVAALRAAGFRRIRTITWLGGGIQLGGDSSRFARRAPARRRDYILVGTMPGARLTSQRTIAAKVINPAARRWSHEKPAAQGVALARIARVRRGHVVVDPYCGTGALLAGARARGASVLGVDRSPAAIALARERLR